MRQVRTATQPLVHLPMLGGSPTQHGQRDEVGQGVEDQGDVDGTGPSRFPRLIVAHPRKFSEYVLVPGRSGGKDGVFLGRLGYRARSTQDAEELSATYVAQARARLLRGEYAIGKEDEFGVRYVIDIELKGIAVRSAWLLRPDGTLALVTPFCGFARESR